jgi:TonB family protein
MDYCRLAHIGLKSSSRDIALILEAVVGPDGRVELVMVLRSRHALLDNAAVAALKQWRYTPIVLNGIRTPFVLTVTFTFSTR